MRVRSVRTADDVADGVGRLRQRRALRVVEVDLEDLLDPGGAELRPARPCRGRRSRTRPRGSAVHGSTRFSSSSDRVDHLRGRRAGRVPGRRAEQLHELAAALRRALDHRLDPLLGDELAQRDAADRRRARRPGPSGRRGRRARPRCTSLTDAPVSQAMNVWKRAVSRMPAWPKTRSFGKPGDVLRDVAHRVERVRDDDEDRVGALRDDLLGHRP